MKTHFHLVSIVCLIVIGAAGCGKKQAELVSAHGQSVDHWVHELKRPEPKARKSAVAALQSVGVADPAALPAIVGALNDSDARVRDAATIALLNIGPPAKDAVSALSKAKTDRDATVRSHAEAALRRIGDGG
jgi:HEAT repeat protein